METIRSSMEKALALQLRLADCQQILNHSKAFADSRWEAGANSFLNTLNENGGFCTVNSATGIAVIGRCERAFEPGSLLAYHGFKLQEIIAAFVANYKEHESTSFWESRETTYWSPYVTSYVLNAIASALSASDQAAQAQAARHHKLKDILLTQTKLLVEYLGDWAKNTLKKKKAEYDHVYFAFTAVTAVRAIKDATKRAKIDAITDSFWQDSEDVVTSVMVRMQVEFFSQMTFKLGSLPQHLDLVALVLSMHCLVMYGGAKQLSDDIVDSALNVIMASQEQSGLWNTATPLLGVETGRIGCSSIELTNCLLRIPRVSKRFEEFFPHFDRLFVHLQRGFDPNSPKLGWPVDLRRNNFDRRQSWYSFYCFEFLALFSELIERTAAQLILRDFQYGKAAPRFTWEQIADFRGFKDRIHKNFIEPRLDKTSKGSPKFSMILFGPPGTGKTTFASALAHKLGWGLIQIGPSDFLGKGIDGIFAEGDLIFQRLLLLRDVVVLFDEIDELVRHRGAEPDKTSRFLTTYMLPWIQRLRDKAAVVFIFATNHIEIFDPAIKRIGRFDVVVPIGPPQDGDRAKLMDATKLGLTGDSLLAFARSIPPQATTGEISAATLRLLENGEAINADTLKAELSPEKLLMTSKEWTEFENEAKKYLT